MSDVTVPSLASLRNEVRAADRHVPSPTNLWLRVAKMRPTPPTGSQLNMLPATSE